jgi:hypothetical protein
MDALVWTIEYYSMLVFLAVGIGLIIWSGKTLFGKVE